MEHAPHATSLPEITVIDKTAKETVDENNAMVVDLVSAGYSIDESIDAVDKYGTLEAALTHLEMDEEEEEEGGALLPQLYREDSDGVVPIEW